MIWVLEGLLEYELSGGSRAEVTESRLRRQEYLLERHMFRRLSTGEVIIDRDGGHYWTRFAFPTLWYHDVLRGLEYLREAGVTPDERVAEAVELVESKRDANGRWPLEAQHPGTMAVEVDEARDVRGGGIHSGRYGCWTGIQHKTYADIGEKC